MSKNAPVAELVDALDSKSSSARSAGSIPARGTKLKISIISIIYSLSSISGFRENFRDALKRHVKVHSSRPFCWHFCWYRGSKRSRRISLCRTRELGEGPQGPWRECQPEHVDCQSSCEGGYAPTPSKQVTRELSPANTKSAPSW